MAVRPFRLKDSRARMAPRCGPAMMSSIPSNLRLARRATSARAESAVALPRCVPVGPGIVQCERVVIAGYDCRPVAGKPCGCVAGDGGADCCDVGGFVG